MSSIKEISMWRREEQGNSKRLSTVIGFLFAILFFLFFFAGLFWSYTTTYQFVGKQLSDTFKQKHSIAENIISNQQDLLQYSLRAIQNHGEFTSDIIQDSPEKTRKVLVRIVESVQELPFDILFMKDQKDKVFADASSPFFNSQGYLPAIIDEYSNLTPGESCMYLKNGDEDLAVLVSSVVISDPLTGKVLGTLFGGIVLNNNMSLLHQIKRETRSEAVFLTAEGNLVATTTRDEELLAFATEPAAEEDDSRSWIWGEPSTHIAMNMVVSKRMELPWNSNSKLAIAFAIPDTIFADVRKSYLVISATSLLIVLLIFVISIIIVRKLTIIPLRGLLDYSNAVSAGQFDTRYKGGNIHEFDQIGQGMERMVQGLQELNEKLQRDIAGRKKAEKALMKSELLFRTVVATIPELVWLKNTDGVYLTCNPRFEQFFGARQDEIVGKTDYDFVDKELADFFRAHDKKAMTAERPCVNEEEVTYASDGHMEHLETIKTPMVGDDGALIGVLGIARDITERKEAEKERLRLEAQLLQAHKMEAIGTMAGGIAHDFNNILAAILGNAEMVREKIDEDHPARKSILQVIYASNRAKELIRHILTFSSMAPASRKAQSVNLAETIGEVLNFQRSIIPSTIKIISELDEAVSTIEGDETQLHQVVMNLCTNAAHAMEEKGGTLHVAVTSVNFSEDDLRDEPHQKSGKYVKLIVSDTGQGMTAELLGRIFDPYYTTKEVGKGSGMGLSVVLGIVKKHNGFMRVESTPGKGSSFFLFFPSMEHHITEKEGSEEHSLIGGTETILYVDDEEMLVDLGKINLERFGYSVVPETDSVRALERFKESPGDFDLVITDQTMPNLTGVELAAEILAVRPAIPVLLCTGYSSKVDESCAHEIGVKGVLSKPVEVNVIAAKVREVLDDAATE